MGADRDIRYVEINKENDVAHAVFEAHDLSSAMGFRRTDQFMIATSVSELARNASLHGGGGRITLRAVTENGRTGIEVIAEDTGSGIADIDKALQEGFSTIGTLGLGLPGVKRLMDEFCFDDQRKQGTRIVVRKWLR
ncbi:anti-sigma regulatory factor [Marinobacter nanhaiticus D15-8W]|uniref:ATP-binding protein n=1 Tax=Marinobacter nanhaiticus D15-8W TaxID=626887 RepID=N6WP13_9GAMM|nr:anti-sigma regulatory factor [Marinobacter nanhaiticus]ENO12772.1 ATP-binding protein [Marinobacter nanhaiticus D15-8W]BES70119.1 anti-sigma regulatory factor [Marinobacter nanhaiticus D15-8W]